MCGRFAQINTPEKIAQEFDVLQTTMDFEPSYNVAPSNDVAVVIYDHHKGVKKLGTMRWGLIPNWAKDKSVGYKMINSRSESLTEKPSFQIPFTRKRCLIPASGFYEWKKQDNRKIPFYFHLKNREIFGFAGIFDKWISSEGKNIFSCSIITTSANELVKEVHHRMPVILSKQSENIWLDNSRYDKNELLSFLKSYEPNEMQTYQVSPFVNSPQNNSVECIKPL
ncbi:MAG: SOS response-associated peptidase [Candidatus Cloacimonadota bacterium]|nr:SOS response-associated peptidase [Candidatus Cloacimonadota bacterium]